MDLENFNVVLQLSGFDNMTANLFETCNRSGVMKTSVCERRLAVLAVLPSAVKPSHVIVTLTASQSHLLHPLTICW